MAARSSLPTSHTALVQDGPCEQSRGSNPDPGVTPPDTVAHPSPTNPPNTHTIPEHSLPAALLHSDPPTVPLHVGSHALTATAPRWHLRRRSRGQQVAAVTAGPRGRSHSTPRAVTPSPRPRGAKTAGPLAPPPQLLFSEPHSCRECGKPQRPSRCLCMATMSGSNPAERGGFKMIGQVVMRVWTGGARTAQPLRAVVHLDPAEDCSPGDGL